MKKTIVVFVIISLLLSILNLGIITASAAIPGTSGGLLTSDILISEAVISTSPSLPDVTSSSIITPVANIIPVANAGGPYSANTGEKITLSASNSYDADGSITGYIWDFNSDEIWDTEWLTSPLTTYTYSTAGTYTAKLQVKDNIGATTVATSTVTITTPTSTQNNPDSTLGFESASPDEPITNNDVNSEPGLDSIQGQDAGDIIIIDGPDNNPGGDIDSTQGRDAGDIIIIDGPDDDGPTPDSGEANDDIPIITTNSFIANAGKPYYGTAGVPVQFDASGSAGAVTYDWDFGDETTGAGKTPTHTYTESGEYYVTLTITNNAGSTLIDITPVYISQTGNHLKPYGKRSYSAEKYETITFDASQSTSTDSNAPIVSYTWYFGDGDTATGKLVTHSYSISRVYLVVLEVTDSEGNKKQDVLHADVGRDLTKMDDFFILSDLADIFTSIDLYSYFDVSIYTNYNGVEKNTPVRAGSLPVSIDVNNDGSNDISVGSIKLFELWVDKSQFNGILWFVFITTLSKVSILSGGSISQSDEFTVCLQMSLNKIPNLDLDEKRVRVGYYSAAGEAKPSGEFGVKHFFRPYLFLRSSDIYPEVGSSIFESGGAGKFSLFTNFADVNNPMIQSTMTLHYDPFIKSTLVHRRGKTSDGLRLYDIAFQGSGSSAVSLYFTRQNTEGSASVGVLIDPIQNFVFHVDATPLVAGGGSITFRSDELIDNIVLFAKSKDPQGDKDIYFYLKNLPKSIDVQWDPSLKDGFIRASNVQGNELLEVGICNDLNTPNWKINATNLPSSVDLSWDLSVEGQIQLKTTNTGDIALDYYGWRENRTINFHVDSEDDINVAASWNLEEGWFKVLKSDALVNFGFSILQKGMPKGDLLVDLSGNLSITREGEDLEVLFGDFEQGKITINNAITGTDVSVGVNVKYGALEAGVESLNLGASGGGSAVINWDDTPRFKVEANLGKSTYLEMSKFKLKFNKLNMSIGTLDLYGAGYAEVKWNEASKTFGIGASARLKSTNIVLGSEGLYLSAGSFDLGGAASANIAISEGFSVNAGANIQLGNFDIRVGGLNLKIGSFHLDGGGSASVKKGSLESLQLQGSTTFGVGNVNFSYNSLSIKIQGSLDVSAGGTLLLDKSQLKLEGALALTIPNQCVFVINAETIKIQGTFKPTNKGSLYVSWVSSNSINLGASISGTIDNFYCEYQTLKVSSGNINLRGNGDVDIGLGDTFTASGSIAGGFSLSSFVFTVGNDNPRLELTKIDLKASGSASVVSGNTLKVSGDVAFYLESLYFNSSTMEFKIDGSIDLDAGGYVEVGDKKFEMSVSGGVDLGCTFHVNGKIISVAGAFNLGGAGTIALNWDNNYVDLSVIDANVPLSVTNLNFVYDQFTLSANTISFNAGGKFHAEWNTAQNSIKIEGGPADLTLNNARIKYGTQLDITIGSLKLNAGGYVLFQDKLFEIKITGSLDLNTNFVMGGKNIKAVGNFNLNGLTGTVQLKWDNNYVEISIPEGGATLNVNNLEFGYGTDLTLKADNVNFGLNGKLYVGWNAATPSLDISGGSANLAVTNVYITQGSSLDIDIVGSLSLQAGGSVHFENQLLRFIGSASVSLSGTTFKINSNSIYAKGTFLLQGGTGTIDLSWSNNFIKIYVSSGSLKLDITNLEVQYGTFNIKANTINVGAGGQFNVQWDTTLNTLEITGVSASLSISNVYITYGSSLDIDIDGSLSLEASGKVFFKNGLLRLSGSANFNLVGTKITINSQSIKAEGSFALQGGAGVIEFTWDAENIGVKVTGGASLTVTNPYLETQKIILDADQATLGVNGNLDVQILKTTKVFKVSGNVDFKLTNLIIKYESTQIFSSTLFDIKGGGTVNIGNTYSLQLSASVDIDNLDFNPPDSWSWPLNYVKGSFALSGSGTLSAGDGTFNMAATIQGSIDQFDITFSANYIKFNQLQLYANAGVSVDLITNSEFKIVSVGRVVLNSFQAKYGSWVGSIYKLDGDGAGSLSLRIRSDKYGKVWANGNLLLESLSITRDNLVFSIDYLYANGGGGAEIDLGQTRPRFDIKGNGALTLGDGDPDIIPEGLFIKTQGGWTVNIPSSVFTGNGRVYADWDDNDLYVYTDLNVYWKASINTQTYGSWYVTGSLTGGAAINAYWTTSTSGQIVINIPKTGVMSSLQITHDTMNIVLGQLTLQPGTMTINWNRGDAGYVNINNPITGTLEGLQLTYGTTFILNIGKLNLVPGYGEIKWDKTNQEVQVTNGIISGQGLGFTLTLNDVVYSASVLGIQKNTQPIVIRWYKDASGINGGYINTNNQALASWIDFTVTQSGKGVRITLYGLQANNFDMKKSTSGQWQLSGSIQLANQLTVALLYDGTWHTIDLQWSFPTGDLETKWIKYTCSETITIQLSSPTSSFTIKDWTFPSTTSTIINLYAGSMKLDWHFSSTSSHIRFDTGGKSMGSITFEVNKGSTGFKFDASVLKASNVGVTWNGWPPKGITWDGTIELVGSISAKWSGSTWYKIYPLTMTNNY